MTSRKLTQMFLSLAALVVLAMTALAGDPGAADPGTLSDQKAGSILYYNVYSSSSTNPAAENARIAITNTDDAKSALVHLFFVDGKTCSVADSFICLTKSQTATILASDVDPDVMGYIVAVAVDTAGKLNASAKLIGDEYVKLASGHVANLGAEAISDAKIQFDDINNMTEVIEFNAPRVLAVDNVPSAKDGNDTLLIINTIGKNLVSGDGNSPSGGYKLFGLLFDELENSYSYTFSVGCQLKATMNDSFPRTAPRFTSVVPSGTSGWTKFWATSTEKLKDTAGADEATAVGKAILGSVINKNTTNSPTSFNGGHNLHKLTYVRSQITIPVFNAMGCDTKW